MKKEWFELAPWWAEIFIGRRTRRTAASIETMNNINKHRQDLSGPVRADVFITKVSAFMLMAPRRFLLNALAAHADAAVRMFSFAFRVDRADLV